MPSRSLGPFQVKYKRPKRGNKVNLRKASVAVTRTPLTPQAKSVLRSEHRVYKAEKKVVASRKEAPVAEVRKLWAAERALRSAKYARDLRFRRDIGDLTLKRSHTPLPEPSTTSSGKPLTPPVMIDTPYKIPKKKPKYRNPYIPKNKFRPKRWSEI